MFGTLRVTKCVSPELYRQYRSYYCGLCTLLAREYGSLARATVNYDATFFYMLLDGLNPAEVGTQQVFCPTNPLAKRTAVLEECSGRLAAAANVYLVGLKLRDDIADEGRTRAKKAAARLAYRAFRRWESLAARRLADAGMDIERAEELFRRQREMELESLRAGVGDEHAALAMFYRPTEDGLALLFSEAGRALGVTRADQEALSAVGGSLGRIIYIMDSFVDYPADARCERFNALAQVFGDHMTIDERLPEDVRKSLISILSSSVEEAKRGIQQLSMVKNRELAQAVLAGLARRIAFLIEKTESLREVEEIARRGSASYLLTHPGYLLRSRAAYREYRRHRDSRCSCCCAPDEMSDLITAAICCDAADCDCDAAEGCAQGDCCEFIECCG